MSVDLNPVPSPRHDPEMSNLVYRGGISAKHERIPCPGGSGSCNEVDPHEHYRSTVVCECGGSTQVQFSRMVKPANGRARSAGEGKPVTTTDMHRPNPCGECQRLRAARSRS